MTILTSGEPERDPACSAFGSRVIFMSQSTIFQRNMARRRQTAALQGDPRSAAIRVMSGLPLLSAVFPPYVPKSDASESSPMSEPTPSESIVLHESDDTFFFSSTTESSRMIRDGTLFPVIASSVVGGMLSEVYRCKPTTASRTLATSVSPFSGKSIVLSPAAVQLVGWNQPHTSPFVRAMTLALPGAVHMSLLFTTKEFFEDRLKRVGFVSQDASVSVSPVSVLTIVSSTLAGGILSGVRTLHVQGASTPGLPSYLQSVSTPFYQLRGREVLGATVYFTTYEALKVMLTPSPLLSRDEEFQRPCWAAIGFAGAIAGTAYESLLQQSLPLGLMRWSHVVRRAAPTHALMFLGYEATRDILSTV